MVSETHTNSKFLPSTELKTGGHITNLSTKELCEGETVFILGQKSGLMHGTCSEIASWSGCPTISRGIAYTLDGSTRYLVGFQSAAAGLAGQDNDGTWLYSETYVAEAGLHLPH